MTRVLFIGIGAFFALALLVHAVSPGPSTPPASQPAAAAHASAAPATTVAGTPSTRELWARAFLKLAGFRRTPCNKGAIEAWEAEEGSPAKRKNPLNDTLRLPGSVVINGAGVRRYKRWIDGLRAAVTTLRYHPAIERALRRGNNAQAVADAVRVPSTSGHLWGTHRFTAACLPGH